MTMLVDAGATPASPFFAGIRQIDLTYDGHAGRLPLFFADGATCTALFPARIGALRRLLPDRRLTPARIAPGVGLVAVMAVEYKASDVGAYEEVLVAIVLHDGALNTPVALAAGALRGLLRVHVLRMPVTTEIALATGRRFWNYPKFLADIDVVHGADRHTCTLAERGRHILTLDGPRVATPRSQTISYLAGTYQDGQPQLSEFRVHERQTGIAAVPGSARISLGDDHPMARELAGALIGRRALAWSVAPSFEAILFGPERLTPNLAAALGEQTTAVHLPPLPDRAPEHEGPVG